MAQKFESSGSLGGSAASGLAPARAAAVPVVEVGSALTPVPLIDLGALAATAGERALASLISDAYAMPVDERLAARSVDSQLFTLLSRLDLDAADDATLAEAAAGAERVEAAAHAIKLRAAAHLSRRQAMRPAALDQRGASQRDVAGDELAVRLGTTVRAGMDLVRRGKALEETLFATGDALAQGVIDAARARVIVDGLEHVSAEVAATVESRILERAPRRTVAQLRSDVAKALIEVDADEAAERARHREKERRVSRPRAHTDGIASMRLEGPAADVLALDVALQAAARAAKAAGDRRSMDQLRFDSLAGIAHRALSTGWLGGDDPGLPLGTQNGHRPTILVTVPLDQLLPRGAAPVGAPEGTDTRTDDGAWPRPLPGEQLRTDQVPSLEGYGPISPALARALAAGGDWIRIVTDPLTGAVLDVGHTRYRPTQAMVDHILARDRTCVRPGCAHRASECQLDHTQEWNHENPGQGGRTAVSNLGPLCGRDHQVKTHGDFHLTQPEAGVFEWTTPTGHRYRRELDGTTTALSHATHRPRYGIPTTNQPSTDDSPGAGNGTDPPSGGQSPPTSSEHGGPLDYGPPPF